MAIGEVSAWPGERAGWSLAGEYAVPSQIGAQVKVGEFVVSVIIRTGAQGPQVTELHVEHPRAAMGEPVTQVVLRQITIDKIVREAVAKVRRPAHVVNRELGQFAISGEDGIWVGAIKEGRGSRAERGQLVEVAETYLRAMNEGRPPAKAVSEELKYSRSHAGRLVGEARKAGLLPPTSPGQASVPKFEIFTRLNPNAVAMLALPTEDDAETQ
jgi:hypothetical protein